MSATDTHHKVWTVEVILDERGDETQAKATLEIDGTSVGGWGRARKSPADPRVPRIGDELAVARALGDLAHRILDMTAVEIEQFSAGDVRLHG